MILTFALFVLAQTPSSEIVATATADRAEIRLSDPVFVTLAVEGPAPLRVEVPDAIPDATSAEVWRVRPAGPAKVTSIADNRERWEQVYRADPFVPGSPLPLGFAAGTVRAGTDPTARKLTWPPVDVTVTTTLIGATAADARPITGIEELPPLPPTPDRSSWLWLLAAAGIGLGVLLTVLRMRRRPETPTPLAVALAELDALQNAGHSDVEFADRLSLTVRRFIEDSTGIAAIRRTTEELLAESETLLLPSPLGGEGPGVRGPTNLVTSDLPASSSSDPSPLTPLPQGERGTGTDLRAVLTACDRVRFAAGELTSADRETLLAVARRFVRSASRTGLPGVRYSDD